MAKEIKQNYSSKKVGPIHLVYAGKQHIGNVMEPTIGGTREGAQHYTAISKFWGIKKNHDTKMQALQWLRQQHGEPMQMESTNINQTYIYEHTSGMKGEIIHNAKSDGDHNFISQPNNKHKLAGPFIAIEHASMAKAHKRMTALGYRLIGEASNWNLGNAAAPEMDTVGVTAHTEMDRKKKLKYKRLIRKYPDQAGKTIDLINGSIKTHEAFMNVWKNAKLRNEELFDKDVNEKDPKAGPRIKKDDPTGDIELQIKKTATGKLGDVIAINPKMKVRQAPSDYSGNDVEHKSKPAV